MQLEDILNQVELFQGLRYSDLEEVADIFKEETHTKGEFIAKQGSPGDSLFIIIDGFVEVVQNQAKGQHVLINLGKGQIFGEMSLVDQGPRSASVIAISDPTVLQAVRYSDFVSLFERNNHIGYIVMRNIAADLSFKLRKQNLAR
jgi:CRP/FNR family transcriptional regulator, cyclic AMP receptor protein